MSEKRVLNHKEQSISSSELAENLKTLLANLMKEIEQLQNIQKKNDKLVIQSHELHKIWKNNEGNEQVAGQYWKEYKTYFDLTRFMRQQIQAKLKFREEIRSLYEKQKEKQYKKLMGQR